MPVKVEAFLALESSLSSRLYNAYQRDMAKNIKKIVVAVNKSDFTLAYALVTTLDMAPSIERNINYIEFVGMAAAVMGSTQLTPAKQTQLANETKPEMVVFASNTTARIIAENGTSAIRSTATKQIDNYEQHLKQEQLALAQKADQPFARPFVSAVNDNGKAFIDISSSLHTSRLSAWGYTVEADALGIEFYAINAQLDNRLCPICRITHGKVFSVMGTKSRLEMLMNVENPDDLKMLSPWPSQNKAAVAQFEKLTNNELVANGWQHPPYHPLCRCLLVKTGTVPPLTTILQQPLRVSPTLTADELANALLELPPPTSISPPVIIPKPKPTDLLPGLSIDTITGQSGIDLLDAIDEDDL